MDAPSAASQFRHRFAPRIETERLILRGFEAGDFDAYHATMQDPEVMRYLGAEALGREEATRRMSLFCGFWELQGRGMWGVERKEGGPIIGHVGLFDLRRDMQPSIEGMPEMGWIFDRSVHGQGIAYEAAKAALDWHDATYGVMEIPAIIARENQASMRLAEKLGFVRDADATYKGEAIALFRRAAG
ncbi:MAG TPA: GNAT family N-acetyltransferase [Sphingomicrobium sp.]|nr:GNAT family N-acetyltransferase [Sphingomicrobium sp.]